MTRAEGGFTVTEVLVAVVVLGLGVLGLAGTVGLVTRQIGRGRTVTIATEVANERLDLLRRAAAIRLVANGPRCQHPSFASSASPVVTRGVTESWKVLGTGAVRTAIDSVTYTRHRGTSTIAVSTRIACN